MDRFTTPPPDDLFGYQPPADSLRGARGLTADECAEAVGLDRWSIQPRVSELRRKLLIVDSGARRFNSSGKRAIVWTLPQFERGLGDGEG